MGREVVFLADTWRRSPVEKASLISHCLICVPGSSPVNPFWRVGQDPRNLLLSQACQDCAVQSVRDKQLVEGFCGPSLTLIRGITGHRPPNVLMLHAYGVPSRCQVTKDRRSCLAQTGPKRPKGDQGPLVQRICT
jgi:hypothetical protein